MLSMCKPSMCKSSQKSCIYMILPLYKWGNQDLEYTPIQLYETSKR